MNPNVKTSHPFFLFIQNMLFLSILCGIFCASHVNIIRSKRQISVEGELTGEVANRKDAEDFDNLVKILKSRGAEVSQSVENSDSEMTQSLLKEFKNVWNRLVENQLGLPNSNETAASLRTYWAHILFIAKERFCKSPDETFYQEQCLPISTEKRSEHCPENMGLFDGSDNEGICDCLDLSSEKAKSELRQIYSEQSGSCHQQNSQGPCENGQWFILKNTAQCAPAPEGCPTDGRHVYWSPEPFMAKKCWEIYTRGPCEEGKLIHVSQETEELNVYCSFPFSGYYFSYSIPSRPSCVLGTYRSKKGNCSTIRFIG